MGQWKPIREVVRLSPDAKSERSWLRRLPMTHFLFDENIEDNVVRATRAAGFDLVTVSEAGLKGRSDEDIFSTAWRQKRMIVTYDDDFSDDARFPLNRCPGVLQIPNVGRNLAFFWSIVMGPLRLVSRGHDLWFRTKIKVNAQGQMTVRNWDKDVGSVIISRYWMKKDGLGRIASHVGAVEPEARQPRPSVAVGNAITWLKRSRTSSAGDGISAPRG